MGAEQERVKSLGHLDDGLRQAGDWGEDALAGFCDIEQRLGLGPALWNGRDPILKERPFGLTGPQGNHGEDVKEYWWYLDAPPIHSWNRWRYHFPRYWITEVHYAKAAPDEEVRRHGEVQSVGDILRLYPPAGAAVTAPFAAGAGAAGPRPPRPLRGPAPRSRSGRPSAGAAPTSRSPPGWPTASTSACSTRLAARRRGFRCGILMRECGIASCRVEGPAKPTDSA